MSNYLLNPNTPFFNSLILGTSQYTSPELETLVEIKKMRQGVELLKDNSDEQSNAMNRNLEQTISVAGNMIHDGISQGFGDLRTGLSRMGDSLAGGLTRIHEDLSEGVVQVGNKVDRVNENLCQGVNILNNQIENASHRVENKIDSAAHIIENQIKTGVHNVNLNLRQGFTGVVKAITFSNEHLGKEMVRGFSDLARGQKQTVAVMDKGFKRLVSGMTEGFSEQIRQTAYEGQLTRETIGQLGSTLVQDNQLTRETIGQLGSTLVQDSQNTRELMKLHHEQTTGLLQHVAENMLLSGQTVQQLREQMYYQHEELVDILSQGFSQTISAIAHEGLLTRKSIENLRIEVRQIGQILGKKLDNIYDELRRQNRHYEADEDFIVGIRHLNHLRLDDAKKEFRRALKKYGGHYASLFSMGYIAFLENDLEESQQWFGRSLAQAGGERDKEHQQKREQAFASLYLGRVAFTQGKYDDARKFYDSAYSVYPKLFSALIEGAVCLILANKGREAEAGKRIREHFDYIEKYKDQNIHIYWYALALELAVHNPEFALEALRQGLIRHGKEKPCKRNAVHVSNVLYSLNPRYVGILFDLIKEDKDLAWLNQ